MRSMLRNKLVLGIAVVAVLAFAGGAVAAGQQSSPPSRQAFLNDLAKRLGVSPNQLSSALKGAFTDQLQAAVKAGRLTQAQANAIEQRVQQNGLPPFGFGAPGFFEQPKGFGLGGRTGGLGGPGRIAPLAAAAGYLGLSDSQLLSQLASGKSLAQVARQRGKSVAGLRSAMINDARARLDKAVANNVMTKSQEQRLLSNLGARLNDLINHGGRRAHPLGRAWGAGPAGAPPGPPGLGAGPPAAVPGAAGPLPPPSAATSGPPPGV